jgi:hypothetical protein
MSIENLDEKSRREAGKKIKTLPRKPICLIPKPVEYK